MAKLLSKTTDPKNSPKIPESELILNRDGSVYHLSLHPQDIAPIILTVGDPGRVHLVSQHFDSVDFEMNKREFITHTGHYKGLRLTVISTGMGTDNIEILMNELDALVNIDLKTRVPKESHTSLDIIRLGSSGSLQQDLRLGSHLASEYAVGLDTLMCFYNLPHTELEESVGEALQKVIGLPFTPYIVKGSEKLLARLGGGMVKGNTVTCPGFYAPQGRQLRLPLRYPKFVDELTSFHHHDFWLTNFEMETAGYYALGRLLGHEVLSTNALIANRITNRFSKDPNKVIDSLIKKVLDRLVESA
ncbi:MAG TPA: phosphorylase [Cytophagales bacterium]|nr:phosphorylase [Cytophagales bacterium]HAA22481.1 phosphorylase [Cytophagales bacterium]HAP61584.1 phosphorylase [Cytophagales bacterium]